VASLTPEEKRKSSEETNALALRYQQGDTKAAEILLKKFEGYLKKWEYLLTSRTYKIDREVYSFLRLFGSGDINTTIKILRKKLKAYELEDIRQELKIVLLDTIYKYTNVSALFRYLLQRRIIGLIKDPIVAKNDIGIISISEINEDAHGLIIDELVIENKDGNLSGEFDSNWVAGDTCGYPFKDLNILQRQILILAKIDRHSMKEVGEILGIGKNKVAREMRTIRKLVKKQLEEYDWDGNPLNPLPDLE